ncbi:hypothetical protein BH11GEM1_BH11GEM1_28240 [soil metagenome]
MMDREGGSAALDTVSRGVGKAACHVQWYNRATYHLERSMSSLQRTIDGNVVIHQIARHGQMIDQELLARHGRSARTLVKEGPLRLTVIALAAGGTLPSHHADGPVSVQVLDGAVVFEAAGTDYPLGRGDLLVLASGVEHAARSEGGGVVLLTVVHAASPGSPIADA